MSFLSKWTRSVIFTIGCCSAAFGQAPGDSIRGPVLGFVSSASSVDVKPILGVPGASVLGNSYLANSQLRKMVISPAQNYAFAILGEKAEPAAIPLDSDSTPLRVFDWLWSKVDHIAVSPSGNAALAYGRETGILQSLVNWTSNPEVVIDLNLANMPGVVEEVAVSDDGVLALLTLRNESTLSLWLVSASGARWPIAADRPTAATFLANRHDAVIADSGAQTVYMISGLDQDAARTPLISFAEGFDAISAVAVDANRLFVVGSATETVTILDLETGIASAASCHCKATSLHRLKGSLFQLSDPADGPVALLDASAAEARIIVVPAVEENVGEGVLPQ